MTNVYTPLRQTIKCSVIHNEYWGSCLFSLPATYICTNYNNRTPRDEAKFLSFVNEWENGVCCHIQRAGCNHQPESFPHSFMKQCFTQMRCRIPYEKLFKYHTPKCSLSVLSPVSKGETARKHLFPFQPPCLPCCQTTAPNWQPQDQICFLYQHFDLQLQLT